MPTPAERRALLFVAAVAALGLAVRGGRSLRPTEVPASDREALARQIAAVDSAIAAGGRPRGGAGRPAPATPTPAPPAAPVDVNTADVAELDRLPGIGPALAARIVADREQAGPFASVESLQRVKGIGPALAARLAPHVTFSGAPRPSPADGQGWRVHP
ncbi:MAG: helix-hairpin-helix domain-containing protein [Gemmatimonadaceae bacterium]